MRILLIEDDDHVADALREALVRFGHTTDHITQGAQAVDAAEHADFVLLDLGLPDLDGQEVCHRLRESSQVPIMVLSARTEEIDRVLLLQAGADDYLVKPFSTRELVARIDAVSRRSQRTAVPSEPGQWDSPIQLGPLAVEPRTRKASVDGRQIALTRREFDLLLALLADPGAVRHREDLINEAWDPHWHGSTRTLDVHVSSLRAKLGDRDWITSVRGVGFRLAVPTTTSS
ncbi:response regulator transcription factor [Lentzea sp. NPDC003310]|uniref:response regulator transcription factor n=1 Tax=Lentzea sp. NPDC003310 TaxID=3154447 RepID=UPI0033B26EDF